MSRNHLRKRAVVVAVLACVTLGASAGPLWTRKAYYGTSMTACPAGEVLDYFLYYYDFRPENQGASWCGAAAAAVAASDAREVYNKPVFMTSCNAGVSWTYSHLNKLDPNFRYDSPQLADIGMICWAKPVLPEPEPKPELKPESQPEPKPDPKPDPTPDPKPKPNFCSQADGQRVANPIIPGTGEKIQTEQDYAGSGPDGLAFVRSYRSQWAAGGAKGFAVEAGLSQPWSHNHAVSVNFEGPPSTAGSKAKVNFGDGSIRVFDWNAGTGTWDAANSADSLTAGTPGLLYKRLDDDSLWQFDAAGRLLTVAHRNGWINSYTYSTAGTVSPAAPVAGLLISVSNQFGRSLNFAYNANAQLTGVTMPDGQAIGFSYDSFSSVTSLGRLSTVSYPGTSGGTASKTYLYENTTYPQLLTGIIDELGNRLATYAYDADGRATSSEHAGGADLHTVSYGAAGVATVTDPLGTQRTYSYGSIKGKLVVTGADKPSGSGNSSAASRVQDANGFVTQETDFLGVTTMYTWDINRRLPLSTTLASGLPEVQTKSTQWHASFRLPVLVTEAGRTTAYTYDTQGNKLSQTATDTATNVARTTSWTYNPQGLMATQAANDVVTQAYAYYSATSFSGSAPNEVGYTAGDLQSVTNAMGHVTQFTLYDRAGRVRQMVDPKSVVTDIAYTSRGWVSSTSVTPPGGTARTTNYTYDNAGQLIGVTLPDTTTMGYSYDAAHRLKGVTDAKGNTVTYTLDAMGNKVGEQVKDPQGNLQRNITRVYDALNRVQQITGASN